MQQPPPVEPETKRQRARGGRPAGSTRERILDVALELFNEQGYEKTSLREIAERLGVTKAALYYHFERKEDIFLELHLRLHALGIAALESLGPREDDPGGALAWTGLIDYFIDQVVANRDLILLHERNHAVLQELQRSERHQQEHDELEERVRHFLANPAFPLAHRVRVVCAIGSVTGALIVARNTLGDEVPEDELADIVREAVRDLLAPLSSTP